MEWLRGRSHRRPRRNAESFHRAASRSCGMRSRSERAGAPRLPGAAGRTLPCRFVLSRRREPPTIREVWFFFQMVDRRREASGVERRLGADRSRRPWVIVNRRVPNKIGIVLVDSPLRCEAMGRLPPGGDLSTPNFLDEVFRCLAPKASFFLCVGNAAGAARSTQHAAHTSTFNSSPIARRTDFLDCGVVVLFACKDLLCRPRMSIRPSGGIESAWPACPYGFSRASPHFAVTNHSDSLRPAREFHLFPLQTFALCPVKSGRVDCRLRYWMRRTALPRRAPRTSLHIIH